MIASYPSALPYPQLDSLNFKRQKNILETEMASGHARRRLIHQSVPTVMAATWKLEAKKAVIFEAFVDKSLNLLSPFLLKIPTPNGLIDHEVRFKTSPFDSYKPLEHGRWQYQAQIEVKRYKTATEEQAVTELLKPKTVRDFVFELGQNIKKLG